MKVFLTFISIFWVIFSAELFAGVDQIGSGEEFWTGNYFIQGSVDASNLDNNIIRAKVDGDWQDYELTDLPEIFLAWDFDERLTTIENISTGVMPGLAGAHNGMVATYGYKREDSHFKLNNAVKGCGFLPKKERIVDIIKLLKDTIAEDFPKKLEILTGFYEQGNSLFDMTKQVSLELYTVPEHGTQSFLNQMTNPVSVIVYLDIPTFKLKTISYLLHPENPELTDYEKSVVDYVNLIHSYFHGEFSKEFITVIYNVIDLFYKVLLSPG